MIPGLVGLGGGLLIRSCYQTIAPIGIPEMNLEITLFFRTIFDFGNNWTPRSIFLLLGALMTDFVQVVCLPFSGIFFHYGRLITGITLNAYLKRGRCVAFLFKAGLGSGATCV